MEFTKEITAPIQEWKAEDEKNRAFIILSVERKNVTDKGCDYSTVTVIEGSGNILADALYNIMNDKNKKQPLRELLYRALRRLTLDVMCNKLEASAKRIMALAKECGIGVDEEEQTETADEGQGKEDSHE